MLYTTAKHHGSFSPVGWIEEGYQAAVLNAGAPIKVAGPLDSYESAGPKFVTPAPKPLPKAKPPKEAPKTPKKGAAAAAAAAAEPPKTPGKRGERVRVLTGTRQMAVGRREFGKAGAATRAEVAAEVSPVRRGSGGDVGATGSSPRQLLSTPAT